MLQYQALHPKVNEHSVGLIPYFLFELDERPAAVQFDERYQHGGGWHPYGKDAWKLNADNSIQYPGDPELPPLALMKLRDETIIIYPYGLVAIIQPDRSFEISRMD